jgi:hypothetical protein
VKPRARIITMAWGRPYLETLRSLALPAVLAPGNLPSLAAVLECELVIVTEQGFFDELRASPVLHRLEEHCPVRLVAMDDLVVSAGRYGMALTFALHRGFADLGEAMTDHYLVFFNADFILADGALRTVGHRVLAGEQLIHAPSYCAIRERTEPLLRQRVDAATQTLTVSPRDMAAMILAHRHYTIQGKTVNQRVFHSAYIEQFYWQVDDDTLLGRQMPIALVCMRPERVVTEMRTFWDYGVVSELCPNAKPCVLGDSDDFCMLELRREATMLEQMSLGWPEPEAIARTLGQFVTADQKKLGRYPLVLHSRDLPERVESDQQSLGDFVERVYRAMPPQPVPHLDHPFWLDHYEPFLAERARYLAAQTATMDQQQAPRTPAGADGVASPAGMATRLRLGVRRRLSKLRTRAVGRIPIVGPLHPYSAVLRPTYELIEKHLPGGPRRILLVSDHDGPVTQFVRTLSGRGHAVHEAAELLQDAAPGGVILDEVLRRGPFDVLVSEVTFGGLLKLSALLLAVQPALARPAHVIAFHFNPEITAAHLNTRAVITQASRPIGRSEIFFVGSRWTRSAMSLLRSASVVRHRWRHHLGTLAFGGLAGASMIAAGIASLRRSEPSKHALPRTCVGMTLHYELPVLSAESTNVEARSGPHGLS